MSINKIHRWFGATVLVVSFGLYLILFYRQVHHLDATAYPRVAAVKPVVKLALKPQPTTHQPQVMPLSTPPVIAEAKQVLNTSPDLSRLNKISLVGPRAEETPAPKSHTPEVKTVPAKKPHSQPVSAQQNARWSIQVACLASAVHAQDLKQKLQKSGFNAQILVRAPKGNTQKCYRVLVGRLPSRSNARILAEKIDQKLHLKTYIVTEQDKA